MHRGHQSGVRSIRQLMPQPAPKLDAATLAALEEGEAEDDRGDVGAVGGPEGSIAREVSPQVIWMPETYRVLFTKRAARDLVIYYRVLEPQRAVRVITVRHGAHRRPRGI
jgi:hypothetical protein